MVKISIYLNRRVFLMVVPKGNLIHLVGFPSYFTRDTTFVTSPFVLAHRVPSENESTLKGKNFALVL